MKLSVVIPIHNNSNFFSRFLSCITAQLVNDCEFIIVDDGSKESVYLELKNKIEEVNDSRIRLLRLENNQGYGVAVNFGIEHSNGEYVGIYEPDDIIPNDFYSELISVTENIDVDLIKYNGLIRRKNNQDSLIFSYDKEFLNKIFYMHSYKRMGYSHPSVTNGIYKKDFLNTENIRFCKGKGASFQDQQFRVRIWYSNPKTFILDQIKYIYCSHCQQSINEYNKKIDDIVFNWKEEYLYLDSKCKKNKSFYLYSLYRNIEGIKDKISNKNYKKLKEFYFEVYKTNSLDIKELFALKRNINEFIHFFMFSARIP